MEINRNQWFMAGLVLLFLGLQFHSIDSLVLTPEFTKFLAEHAANPVAAANPAIAAPFSAQAVAPKTVRPPEWFGWALISVGAVFVLHSLSMTKPSG
ncbi:MAG: hypothetical protein A2V98_06775 [Planctomycetes bacterium RBG_16_64_12]|nr:MAG: hypothetical protein A2V98_06775 [Planctomycetes bacterium RBG_16_64_12]